MRLVWGLAASLFLVVGCGGGGSDAATATSAGGASSGTSAGATTGTTSGTTTGGAGNSAAAVPIATLKSEATQKIIDFQPFPFMIRAQADASIPEISRLAGLGPAAVDEMLNEFRRAPALNDDVALTLLAYSLEKSGDRRAVPVLAAWLDENMFTGLRGWTTDFVTHAIKVLQGQSGLNNTSFTYQIDEKFDALLQATRANQATGAVARDPSSTARVLHGVTSGNLTIEQKNVCEKRVLITGINAAGQEVTVAVKYKTVISDDNVRAVDPRWSAAERARAANRITGWGEVDETIHGGSDYQKTAGSQITDASNCGGVVVEKVVNQLSLMLGKPINLGRGSSTASGIQAVAVAFGSPVPLKEVDTLTVIAHEKGGNVGHVEVPISVTGTSAIIQSKYDYGHNRLHEVNTNGSLFNPFTPIINKLGSNPYFFQGTGGVNTTFYKIDPRRIRSIVVDSSRCACTPDDPAGILVQIGQPTGTETSARVVTVEGSAGRTGRSVILSGATLTVNGKNPQNLTIANGSFQAQVVLYSGDNEIRVAVEGVDGTRGCAVKKIKSTTAKTSLSATLTWALDNSDVDLYVTQPDNQTAWYESKITTARGTLDVDNTRGIGPENYYISLAADSPLRTGRFSIRVHYFSDRQSNSTTPVRPALWRVVVLLNEGATNESYQVYTGTLNAANSTNAAPGSSGADWAVAQDVTLAPATSP